MVGAGIQTKLCSFLNCHGNSRKDLLVCSFLSLSIPSRAILPFSSVLKKKGSNDDNLSNCALASGPLAGYL